MFEYIQLDNTVVCDEGLVREFADRPRWKNTGPQTSANMSLAQEIGQEVTFTLSSMISMKYVLTYIDGANYKYFNHKHEGKSNAPRILARPVPTYECSAECIGVHEKTYNILVHVPDGVVNLHAAMH